MNFKKIIEQLFPKAASSIEKEVKELRSHNKKLANQVRIKQAEIDLLKRRLRRIEREKERLC